MRTVWQLARASRFIRVWGCLLWTCVAAQGGGALKAGDAELVSCMKAIRFRSDSPADLAAGASRVQTAYDRARSRLTREKHGGSWIRFLQMDRIQECLSALATSNSENDRPGPNVKQSSVDSEKHLNFLMSAMHRFYGLAPGLEMKELLVLRQHLDEVISQYRRNSNVEEFRAEFDRRLQASCTIAGSNLGRHEMFQLLEPHLRWLRRHGETAGQFCLWNRPKNPNFVLHISSSGLNEWGQQTISRTVPFEKQIEGRDVRGEATIIGQGRLQPVPSSAHFSAEYSLDARVSLALSGSQGRLQFEIDSLARADCRQAISWIDGQMIQGPPQIAVSADLNSVKVCTPRSGLIPHLIRRGGIRVIRNRETEIEDSLAHSIADRISDEFSREISSRITDFELGFREQVRVRLQRLGISLDDLASSSTSSGAKIQAVVGKDVGLASPNSPPIFETSGFGQLQIHQSLLNALFHQLFAGRQISDLRSALNEIGIALQDSRQIKGSEASIENATGASPGGLRNPLDLNEYVDQGMVGITFSEDSPMSINLKCPKADETVLELRMSGTSFRFDQYKLSAMDFIVRFLVRNESGRTLLIREEPIQVLPPPSGSSLRFIQQRQLVSSRLQAIFPKRQQFDIRKLMAEFDDSGILDRIQVRTSEGWFTFQL